MKAFLTLCKKQRIPQLMDPGRMKKLGIVQNIRHTASGGVLEFDGPPESIQELYKLFIEHEFPIETERNRDQCNT